VSDIDTALLVLVTPSPVGEGGTGGTSEVDDAVETTGDDLEELLKGSRTPACKVGLAPRWPLIYASPPSLPTTGKSSVIFATSIKLGCNAYSQRVCPCCSMTVEPLPLYNSLSHMIRKHGSNLKTIGNV